MTVTKQQQLEWLASKIVKWPAYGEKIPVSVDDAGNPKFYMPWDTMRVDCTREEWQQERDKMSKTPDVTISNQTSATITATQAGDGEMIITAQDNSWHERGELPPVGFWCEVKTKTFNGWMKCFVVGKSSRGDTVIECDDCAFIIDSSYEFRPLRTEREKAIDEMADLIAKSVFGSAKCQAERLYDSGYRKVKP